jgi:hypothetical protein
MSASGSALNDDGGGFRKADLILSAWKSVLEWAFKCLSLVTAANLAAIVVAGKAFYEAKMSAAAASYVAEATRTFDHGAELGIVGIVGLTPLVLFVFRNIFKSIDEPAFLWSKPNRYNTYRAITVGRPSVCQAAIWVALISRRR